MSETEINAKSVVCREKQHWVVSDGSQMLRKRHEFSKRLSPLKRRSFLRIENLRRCPNGLLRLQLIERVGKVIPRPKKELHIKLNLWSIPIWNPNLADYPSSGNNDAKFKVMDSSSVVSVQHCSNHPCLADSEPQ